MARLVPLHRNAFKHLDNWLRTDLPSHVDPASTVWRAFLRHSKLSAEDAAAAIAPDRDPILFVEEMSTRLSGRFNPREPGKIAVARHLVDRHSADPADAAIKRHLEATVLHELVHWAWGSRGEAESSEKGQDFEREAYSGSAVVEPVAEQRFAFSVAGSELGALSRRFEARGDPGAIGRDRTGGWSFGLYQIATLTGTLEAFLAFLGRRSEFAAFAEGLRRAGGAAAATRGDAVFQRAWKSMALDPDFATAQHDFIQATHYAPYAKALSEHGLDVFVRSATLRDVAWSVSVQHGAGATGLFLRPWRSLGAANGDDAKLINGVYDDRSRVDVHFARSTDAVRKSVLARFKVERADALAMLERERGQA